MTILEDNEDTDLQDIAEASGRDESPWFGSVVCEVVLGGRPPFWTAPGYPKVAGCWNELATDELPLLAALAMLWHLFDEIELDG